MYSTTEKAKTQRQEQRQNAPHSQSFGVFSPHLEADDLFFMPVESGEACQGWIENFIAKYASKLPADQQVDAVSLGTAYWYFAGGEYTAANDLLRQVESSDLQYQLRVRSLSLRSFFELFLQDETYYELLTHEASAFRKFLRRNPKITEQRAAGYLYLAAFLRKLSRLSINRQLTPGKLSELQKALEEEDAVVARQWLREKLSLLA